MLKRFVAALLCLAMMLGCIACAENEAEGKYPTSWDLTQIYESVDDWYADYERALELAAEEESYRGMLNTPEGIYKAFDLSGENELNKICARLSFYCNLGSARMPADPVYAEMASKLSVLQSTLSQQNAYIDEEIFSMSMEEREALFSDPLLADYRYYFEYYLDPNEEPLSEETVVALSKISPALGYSGWLYQILNSSDIPFPTITMPDGSEVLLTDAQFTAIANNESYSHEFKYEALEMYLGRVKPFVNTFAALLEMCYQEYWGNAKINDFGSGLELALSSSDVEPEIYDMLLEAAHAGIEDYQRYLNLHKQGLGYDKQYFFDLNTTLSEYSISDIPYDTAVDTVREALQILGEEYIADYDLLMNSSVTDVYPAEGKAVGAFSTALTSDFLPFVLLNYVGVPNDVNTLAHEMGHSIYFLRSLRSQCPEYGAPSIFTNEVASTTNELLYYNYMIENAESEEERLFYQERQLTTFTATFFSQMILTEIEDWMHKQVEAGYGLNGEEISAKFGEVMRMYRGDAVDHPEIADCQWITIPHFYYNYYMYQYATSMCYAAAICQRITSGEEGAVEAYLNFLDLGSSAAPADLLRVAGVDPLKEETYQLAMDFFADMVDEYEELINK